MLSQKNKCDNYLQKDREAANLLLHSYSALLSCSKYYRKWAFKNNPNNYHFRHLSETQKAAVLSALSQRDYSDGMKNQINWSVHLSMIRKIWPLTILAIIYMNHFLTINFKTYLYESFSNNLEKGLEGSPPGESVQWSNNDFIS